MDRATTNIAKSQIGFIDFIIKPAFESAHLLLPDIYRNIEAIELNKKQWERLFDDYNLKML